MEDIRLRQGLSPEDMSVMLEWANSGGEAFLKQFAGPKWRYPLTAAQVAAELTDIYSIFSGGVFSGIVQILSRQESGVHIGRFLIDPDRAGMGIGTAALKRFCRFLFEDGTIDEITLNVYRFNAAAMRCYQKCGFEIVGVYGDGDAWCRCRMALRRESLSD